MNNAYTSYKYIPQKCPLLAETARETSGRAPHRSESQTAEARTPSSLITSRNHVCQQNLHNTKKRGKKGKGGKKIPFLSSKFTISERPIRVRFEGTAMALVGAFRGGWSFVTKRT